MNRSRIAVVLASFSAMYLCSVYYFPWNHHAKYNIMY